MMWELCIIRENQVRYIITSITRQHRTSSETTLSAGNATRLALVVHVNCDASAWSCATHASSAAIWSPSVLSCVPNTEKSSAQRAHSRASAPARFVP